jgi:hypothetical protein
MMQLSQHTTQSILYHGRYLTDEHGLFNYQQKKCNLSFKFNLSHDS